MKKNSNAFSLVKSMSMSEKRNFKIFSSRHVVGAENKYVLLFNLLDKYSAEDDRLISSELKKHGISAAYLSADKNYLYQLLLRSLGAFHNARTHNLCVKQMLVSVEILFHKGLYHECIKVIERAETLSEECENFQLLIDLLMWKKKCTGYTKGLQRAAEVNNLIDKYLALVNNLKRLTDFYYESNLLQSTYGKNAGRMVLMKFNRILKEPEMQHEKNALSFSAKIYFHLVYSNFYFCIDDKKKELLHLQQLIALIARSKTYATENPLDFVSIYNRLLAIEKHFKDSAFFEHIQDLNRFAGRELFKNEMVAQRVFVHTYTHETEYYLLRNDYKHALVKIRTAENAIAKHQLAIEPYHLIYFHYLHALTLFAVGNFDDSLKFVNRLLNNFRGVDRPAVYGAAELLNVLIHFELGNYLTMLSLARHTLNINKKHVVFSGAEELLLRNLAKMVRAKETSLVQQNKWLRVVQTKLNLIETNRTFQPEDPLNFYGKWISIKLQNSKG